jgi:hypothetical protein
VAPDRRVSPSLDPQARTRLVVWWIAWGAMLGWIIFLQVLLRHGPATPVVKAADLLTRLMGIVPLFVSIVIRWLVLPRCTRTGGALVMFVVGLALAGACAVLGIFLGGPYRDALWLLGLLGVTSYVPLFAQRLLEPKGSGFIPNN